MAEDSERLLMQADALREVGIIGTGKASIAFSELLDCEIKLNVPWVKIVDVENVPGLIASPKELLVEIHSPVRGDLNAVIVIIFSREGAKKLSDMVLEKTLVRDKLEVLDSLGKDVLIEVSNILMASYLTALSDFLGVLVYHSVPAASFILAERSIAEVSKDVNWKMKYALVVATDFVGKEEVTRGKMLLLLDAPSMQQLIKKLGEKIRT